MAASKPTARQNRSIEDLASLVDEKYSRKRYIGYVLWFSVLIFLITFILWVIFIMISLGTQSGALGIGDTIVSLIALIALIMTVSQATSKSNTMDSDEWLDDNIKHNLNRITEEYYFFIKRRTSDYFFIKRCTSDYSEDEKLVLSALIKMKSRNESAKIKDVLTHLSTKKEDWITFLYDIDAGSSLLKE